MRQPDGSIDSLRKPPKSVGYWDGLYSPPEGVSDRLQLEELFFKKLDDKASKVFNRLETSKIALSSEETHTLSVFVQTLMHRNPSAMEDFFRASERQLEDVRLEIRPLYDKLRSPTDPATVEEYEAQEGANAGRKTTYRLFPKLITTPSITSFLSQLNWRIFHRDDRAFPLLLADDPLIRTNGLKNDDGHIAFPLSPNKLVVAAHRHETLVALSSERCRDLFSRVNRQTVQTARHFVVAQDESQAEFVRKHFGSALRPTLGEQMLNSFGNATMVDST